MGKKMYTVLCCGSNGSGQLGVNHRDDILGIKEAFHINFDSKPIDIACGGNHTLILLENGDVYASGAILEGIFEVSNPNNLKFEKVSFNGISKFKYVACGWEFSIFVTIDNEIYSHGEGLNGELGLGKEYRKVSRPKKIKLVTNGLAITRIKTSIHSVIIQLENGELWGWGNNKRGQLLDFGVDKTLKILWKPEILDFGTHLVSDWAMAREFSIFKTNTLEFKGRDNFEISSKLANIDIDMADITSLHSMWSSLHIKLKEKNELISFGNQSHGQLYPTTENIVVNVFTTGSEHGLCYRKCDRAICAWGWGEHGNCGLHENQSSIENVTFDFLNVIYNLKTNEELVSLFGGCATSWIVIHPTGISI